MAGRLDAIIADVIFGWRQLLKHKSASAASILSLALGIGASLAAFQLVEALFLRTLPVAHPEQLYEVTYPSLSDGRISSLDRLDYAGVGALRASVKNQAEVMPLSVPLRLEAAWGADTQIERIWLQYVPGAMFGSFGLKPALGRLLAPSDDLTPGVEPYAVISYDYWSRRFAKDPRVIGQHLRTGYMGYQILEIVGVAPEGFTGTDPGTFTDVFAPNMMNIPAITKGGWNGYRAWVQVKPDNRLDQIQPRLTAALHAYREDQVKAWAPERQKAEKDFFVAAPASLEHAGQGRSGTQHSYERPLAILSALVGFVLLMACINVANLMTAQSTARAREMALRVSLGAGRARLVQLLLIECGLLAVAACILGFLFSWWSAPFIISRLTPAAYPVRLALQLDWRVVSFAAILCSGVTVLFGLVPALRASSTRPGATLKELDNPRAHRRWMHILIAAQVAFCSFVLFIAGLFVLTFLRMANQPTGFSAARVLAIESESDAALAPGRWYQVAEKLKHIPGVESAAVSEYALMSYNAQTRFIWANSRLPDGTWVNSTWFLGVSPGWFETMKLELLHGRDFRSDDEYPNVAIVNEKFAHRYFGNDSPLGHSFETTPSMSEASPHLAMRIVGVVRDARFEDMRMPVPATAYVPFRGLTALWNRNHATFLVRTISLNPMALASTLRRAIPNLEAAMRVVNITSQEELVDSQMVRERLLATVALFFAAVALILGSVGLYGVLNYLVIERRREFGIRIALGASARNIARLVSFGAFAMITVGSAIGIELGRESSRYIIGLLYEVKPVDPNMLTAPLIALIGVAILAAIPPVVRAIRTDPASLLRTE